jgi:lipoyl(octanoyl) transferase
MQNKEVQIQNIGTIRYKDAWELQDHIFQGIVQQKIANRNLPIEEQKNTENFLLFCEHPHVYTLGKSGNSTHLLLQEQELAAQNIDFFHINRGGDITYHGEGQIVGYPILDLDNFFTDIHLYLRYLEEAVIRTLAEYGLQAGRIDKFTGVWLDYEKQENPRKICAIGVRTSRWVTMHGFALNVNTDLRYFANIVPCGIADKAVTSLAQELGREIAMEEVQNYLVKHLANLFGFVTTQKKTNSIL